MRRRACCAQSRCATASSLFGAIAIGALLLLTTDVRAASSARGTADGGAGASPTAAVSVPASGATAVAATGAAAASAPASGATRSSVSILQEAVAAYQSAQEITDRDQRLAAFARAELLFRTAIEQGHASADLWADLGTAALQAEHLGSAIAAYRHALLLDPDNRRAGQNLEHARTLLPAWVPRPESESLLDSFFAWHRAMAASERAGAAAIAFALACALLGAGIARRSVAFRFFSLIPAVAWGLLLASLVVGDADERAGAVIVADDTVARAADSRNAPARFAEPLPSGTEVRVAEKRGEWTRVLLADGRDAWVPSSGLERVGIQQ